MTTAKEIKTWYPQLKKAGGAHEPESIEEMLWVPYECDCGAEWHGQWRGFGFANEAGKIVATEWSCDADGNWDCDDSVPIRQYDKAYKQLLKDSAAASLRYSQWVAKHGRDPLSEFMVSETKKVEQRWGWEMVKTPLGDPRSAPYTVRHWAYTPEVGEWFKPNVVPREVADYVRVADFTWEELSALAREPAHDTQVWSRKIGRIACVDTIEVTVPNTNYKAELMALAAHHIKREASK